MSKDAVDSELLALLGEAGDLLDEPEAPVRYRLSGRDRLERAFIEILEFVGDHGREPDPDCLQVPERKLGARLVGIRADEAKIEALRELDTLGLLAESPIEASFEDVLQGDDLAGLLDDDADIFDVSTLPQRTAESPVDGRAVRVKASDFEAFQPVFEQAHADLASGALRPVTFAGEESIREDKLYLLKGMLLFVAEVLEPTAAAPTKHGKPKQRLRVIFENGTESNMYRSSLAVRLYEDDGQVLSQHPFLTDEEIVDADIESGHIYVLRSLPAPDQ